MGKLTNPPRRIACVTESRNGKNTNKKPMNDKQRKVALELLNELVEKYELVLTETLNGNHRKVFTAHGEALESCGRLKGLLTSPTPAPTSTVWVGLAPATIERLLATNETFSRQYEERSKTPGKQFAGRGGMVIEFIGTELGLCLGVKLLILREGLTRLSLPEIILAVEEVKEKFAAAMETLGVPDTKELLEVFVTTT